MFRKPVFFTGNYRKLKRGLSQTPWYALVFLIIIRIVDGRRKTEGSVEEYILDVFKQKLEVRIGRGISS